LVSVMPPSSDLKFNEYGSDSTVLEESM
jgi:hypothetical protein